MTANSAEYQKQYRQKYRKRMKEVTVCLPTELHKEFKAFAASQDISLSGLMREATDLQIRSSQLKARAIAEELKELRFLISNIANNMNQMARHSNRVKQVVDENGLYQRLQQLDQMVVEFVDSRLNEPL